MTALPRDLIQDMAEAVDEGDTVRLAGQDIPLAGRIMALADVYDALRSKRPYKPAFSHEKSCGIILEGAGQHFDPAVIEVFMTVESEFAEIRQQMANGAE